MTRPLQSALLSIGSTKAEELTYYMGEFNTLISDNEDVQDRAQWNAINDFARDCNSG